MQRQRDELVPVAEVIADLPGPVQALRKTPPPARRGFTLADQVNQLVGASEADPDLGFMARRCCMIQLRREWGRFSNFSFRTPQRRISAYRARPSGLRM